MKILCVVGARPNFMKLAPIIHASRDFPNIEPIVVHTGQHYDPEMSDLFFHQLDLPAPDINLEVGSGSHAQQTAEIMRRFEPVVKKIQPEIVMVVGDVNSTIACGLVSVKMGVKLVHIEAGLRSFDRSMPEEINRILTDAISDLLFCTEESGVNNLLAQGINKERIFFVGNVMIDTLLHHRQAAMQSTVLTRMKLRANAYAVLTLHRPSNVDDVENLDHVLRALDYIQKRLPIVFPVHPRTEHNLSRMGRMKYIRQMENVLPTPPLGYLDFLRLMTCARLVLTDSGGVQEETTILEVPCLTLRNNTERPITISMGTNRLVGNSTEGIINGFAAVLKQRETTAQSPPLWDGKAAQRICNILAGFYGQARN